MILEPIGALFALAGVVCLLSGEAVGIFALLAATLFGASAAAILTAAGNANIQPAHLLLIFLAFDLVLRPSAWATALESLAFPRAGFWLLLAVTYGAIVTIFMPRLFDGASYVFNLAQADSGGASIVLNPLRPVSANFTQMVYLAGDLVCFLVFCAYARSPGRLSSIANAVIACAFVNAAFAALDIATFSTGTSYLLDPIRNSSYRILDAVELGGIKRIVGSFPEASAFAYASIGLFGFTSDLWLKGLHRPYAGAAALLSLFGILLCTSTAGYFGVTCFVVWQYACCAIRIVAGRASVNDVRVACFGPVLCAAVVAAIWMSPEVARSIQRLFEIVIFDKLDSESGIERAAWNSQALNVLFDTRWLGAGVGSVRASSWPIAVLASTGLVGAILFAAFVVRVLATRTHALTSGEKGIVSAARSLCIAQLFTSLVAVSFVDLGLLFFALAGVLSGATISRVANVRPAHMAIPALEATGIHGK